MCEASFLFSSRAKFVHVDSEIVLQFELVNAFKRHRRNTVYQSVSERLVLGDAVRILQIRARMKLRQHAPCEARKVRNVLMISYIKSFSLQYFSNKSF